MIQLQRLDHLVLTVADIDITCQFYQTVLGCKIIQFAAADSSNRYALSIGEHQKINLHKAADPFLPAAHSPLPGSADLCFLTQTPVSQVLEHLHAYSVPIVEGPIQRTGTLGPILSVYIRDPDHNLVEIANFIEQRPLPNPINANPV